MKITISEMVKRINEAISGGNQLAQQFKEKSFYYHDLLSQVIKQQITSGTPDEKPIVLVRPGEANIPKPRFG